MHTRTWAAAVLAATVVSSAVGRAQGSAFRTVDAEDAKVIPLSLRVGFVTMVALPDGEEILDALVGDKASWPISFAHNNAYIKVAVAGAATNLHLVTASGAVYSFTLTERSERATPPDLKVYVGSSRPQPLLAKFVAAEKCAAVEAELVAARAVVPVTPEVEADVPADPVVPRFSYDVAKNSGEFGVRAIWEDGTRTFIQIDAAEMPVPYETVDGKPSLLSFRVLDSTLVVDKVLTTGYLAMGEKKMHFAVRKGSRQ